MKTIVAKRAGFCFGVKRAVNIAYDLAQKKSDVFTLGPIIHNPQVVNNLREKGISSLEEPTKDMKTVIIRTHGIPVEMYEKINNMGIEIVDATCPFVKKAQQYAKLLNDEGYQVILLGDKDHPEVKSIMSYAGEDVIVVKKGEFPDRLKGKIGLVVQTTQPVTALKELLCNIIEKTKELKIYNTICNSTALRVKETEEMSKDVDIMIIAGGKNSANTTQLANLSRSSGVRTYHLETAEELEPEWLKGAHKIGITAGASTPDWIIEAIVEKIQTI